MRASRTILSTVLLLSLSTSGCNIIARSPRSLYQANEQVSAEICGGSTTTETRRFVTLVTEERAQPDHPGEPSSLAASGITAAIAPVALKAAEYLIDQIVEGLEDEAERYTASYSAICSTDNFYQISEFESRQVRIQEAVMHEWMQSHGRIVPSRLEQAWQAACVTDHQLQELDNDSSFSKEWDKISKSGLADPPENMLKAWPTGIRGDMAQAFTDLARARFKRHFAVKHGKAKAPPFALNEAELATTRGVYSRVISEDHTNPARMWILTVTDVKVTLPRSIHFTREGSAEGNKEPVVTTDIEGLLQRTQNGARIVLTKLTYHASAAKAPAEQWWMPVLSLVSSELEHNIDLVIHARLEGSRSQEDGSIIPVTLLDEPIAQINGIKLNQRWAIHNGKKVPAKQEAAAIKITWDANKSPYRSGEFALPDLDGTLYAGRASGSLRLTLTVQERNKAGDYIRKAANAVSENKDDILEKIKKQIDKLVEKSNGDQ